MKKILILLSSIALIISSLSFVSWYTSSNSVNERRQELRETMDVTSSDEYWEQWVRNGFSKLRASGKEFDETELLGIMLETNPIDKDRNYDFEEGYRRLEKRNSKMVANLLSGKKTKSSISDEGTELKMNDGVPKIPN